MDNKYQYGALLLAVIIGAVIGSIITIGKKDNQIDKLREAHKKELQEKVELALKVIESRQEVIQDLQEKASLDSLAIIELTKQIEIEGAEVTKKQREELKNLNHDQKVTWLINRYTRKSD